MKISVCVAVYNGAKFIERQLKSILMQLSTDDEIIISDDGSTDTTLPIIRYLADDRIKIFINNKRKGPVGNFENAITHAEGNIIFLSDQDDIWFENKIKEHVNLHRKYDIVVSDAFVVDESNKIIFDSFFKQRRSKRGIINNLIKNSYIGCCMSFNNEIVKWALPFPKNIHMHDWWIGLIGELTGKTYFYQQRLMKYVRHDNNASGTLEHRLSIKKQLLNRIGLFCNLVLFLITKKWRTKF